MKLQLDGKTALVTAASKGIGRAIAYALAEEGVRTAVSARPGPQLDAAIAGRPADGAELVSFPADLEDEAATADLTERVAAHFGGLDILIVNTPGPPIVSVLDTEMTDWAAAYGRLFRPALQLALPAAKLMARRKCGSIVFLTSTWVKQPALKGGLSSVMRSGLSALAKQMASELAPYGVRVNQVMPGATATDRTKAIITAKARASGDSEDVERERAVREIPLGRMATPEEIANAVVFLVSPASAFTTGVSLQVDGGAVRSVF
jgi:3-oxoacyl-[acyl-carrier protein] reductase